MAMTILKLPTSILRLSGLIGAHLLFRAGARLLLSRIALGKPIINYYPLKLANGIDLTEGLSTLCKTPEEVNQTN